MKCRVVKYTILILLCFHALHGLADTTVSEWENLATVEVLDSLKGQGTIVLINDQPRILTSSHVTQGNSTASVTIPWREEFPLLRDLTKPPREPQGYSAQLKVNIEFDSPLADIAVVAPDPETDPKIIERLKSYAAVRLCSAGLFSCKNGYERLSTQYVPPIPVIFTANGGQRQVTNILAPYEASLVPDLYITGLAENVLKVPAFAIPGMSGGGYYEHSLLVGIITKIELGGAGEAYAVPMNEVSKVIAPKYFGDRDQLKLPPSRWEKDGNGYRLIVRSGDHTLSMPFSSGKMKAIGGDTGNGGGDTGNGGGDTGNGGDSKASKLWRLDVRDYLGMREVIVNNPFAIPAKSDFTIDGKPISYFKAQESKTDPAYYFSPTIAHYLWLNKILPNSFQAVPPSGDGAQELIKARTGQHPLYGRLYRKKAQDQFELLTKSPISQPMLAGAQVLSPCRKKEGSAPNEPSPQSVWDLIDRAETKDLSLSDKTSCPDEYINLDAHLKVGRANITIPKELASIDYTQGGKPVKLLPQIPVDRGTVIYRSAENPEVQAAIIYRDADMSKIDRIYVETPDLLYELIGCEIGTECYR